MKLMGAICFLLLIILTWFIFLIYIKPKDNEKSAKHCNGAICGSIFSKCQLLNKCNCDPDIINVTCAQNCFKCLDYLYLDCCGCLGICPKVDTKTEQLFSPQSHVEDLPESIPWLFISILEVDDPLERWTYETFPVRITLVTTGGQGELVPTHHLTNPSKSKTGHGMDHEGFITNCTVAFLSDCVLHNRCKSSCRLMGASSYRWFEDGCCECVGPHCTDYGMDKSKCSRCPLTHRSKKDV